MSSKLNRHKVSLLTIGTEVCSGEILNSNAQWLASELTDLHFEVIRHLTVPDDADLMQQSMEFCSADCAVVIITGGLGPTRDDFTRDIVSKWLAKPLQFNEDSWTQVRTRLEKMSVPIAEANKQQCYFPEGAQILRNHAGTANAFVMIRERHHAQTIIVCLPGPPVEIKAVWNDYLAAYLQSFAPAEAVTSLWYWHCVGLSESRLGEVVEEALDGSGYQTGYRPHVPYVDVKVWTPASVDRATDPYLQKLDTAIDRWTVSKDRHDVASLLIADLAAMYRDCIVLDGITQGILAVRLGTAWQNYLEKSPTAKFSFKVQSDYELDSNYTINTEMNAELMIVVRATEPLGSWQIQVYKQNQLIKSHQLTFERKINRETQSRYLSFVAEMTLATLVRGLN